MKYRFRLGLCQSRLLGSEIFSPLHKKSVFCNFRVSGLVGLGQSSGFSGLWAYVVRAQHWARAYGLGPRPVPALLWGLSPNFSFLKTGNFKLEPTSKLFFKPGSLSLEPRAYLPQALNSARPSSPGLRARAQARSTFSLFIHSIFSSSLHTRESS